MSNPKSRTRNNILEMIYSFYEKKENLFFATMDKFNASYSGSDYSMKIGPHHYRPSGDFALMIIANQVTDETDHIRFRYRFERFDQEGVEPFDYEASLTFKFGEDKWSFETSDKKEFIENSYSKFLSEEELIRFVEHEEKIHQDFIQQKIEEA